MNQVSVFTIGLDAAVLRIPIIGLYPEVRGALLLAIVPYSLAAAYLTLIDMFFSQNLKIFYGVMIFLFVLGRNFTRSAPVPPEPFRHAVSHFCGTVAFSTCFYFIVTFLQHLIQFITDDFCLYISLTIIIFAFLVYFNCTQSISGSSFSLAFFKGVSHAGSRAILALRGASQVFSSEPPRGSVYGSRLTRIGRNRRPYALSRSDLHDHPPAAEYVPPIRYAPPIPRFIKTAMLQPNLRIVRSSHC